MAPLESVVDLHPGGCGALPERVGSAGAGVCYSTVLEEKWTMPHWEQLHARVPLFHKFEEVCKSIWAKDAGGCGGGSLLRRLEFVVFVPLCC